MKIKIEPNSKPIFETKSKVRVNDLNYGNHVGHQKVYEFCHDARLEFLTSLKINDIPPLTELNFGTKSLIMSHSAANYHAEIHYPQVLNIKVFLEEVRPHSFHLIYQLYDQQNTIKLATVSTMMICFDNKIKKVCTMDKQIYEELVEKYQKSSIC